MTETVEERARELRLRLAAELEERGSLVAAWRKPFEEVPRHAFVPEVWAGPDRLVTADDPEWLELVYADDVLVTQLTEGVATSSSTAPGLMAAMLGALDVQEGHRVLEVATGTGYNAALLAAFVGAGNVTSVEVDPRLARLAAERLRGAGYPVTVVAGDGRAGHPAGAPYDRLIATCGLPAVPRDWIAQVRPGGIIVCPIGSGTVRLILSAGGEARGHFLPTPSYFMGVRANEDDTGSARYPGEPGNPVDGTSGLAAEALFGTGAFLFLLSLALPGLVLASETDEDGNLTGARLWTADGSWAHAEGRTVRQSGPRRLWSVAERVHELYEGQGRPERQRFGLTVTAKGQELWLDEPGNVVGW